MPFHNNRLHDTRCPASVIAWDLVRIYGFFIERYRSKPHRNVNGDLVNVIWSVRFEVVYEDIAVEIATIVSPKVVDEVNLSWRTKVGHHCRSVPNANRG